MSARAIPILLVAALAASATPSFADDAAESPTGDDAAESPTGDEAARSPAGEEEREPSPPQVVLVDFESIPVGTLPPLAAEASAPESAPKGQVTDLKVETVADKMPA
jgi:hypothetical protein